MDAPEQPGASPPPPKEDRGGPSRRVSLATAGTVLGLMTAVIAAVTLRRRLQAAKTAGSQRDAVQADVKQELSGPAHALAKLSALTAPSEREAVQRATEAQWKRNINRLQAHRDQVDGVTSQATLIAALRGLDRGAIARASLAVSAELQRLGGAECDIGRPPPVPVVRLPVLGVPGTGGGSGSQRASSQSAGKSDVTGPDVNTPSTGSPQNLIRPPNTTQTPLSEE